MLLIDTYVAPSPIEGLGLFAVNDIKRGTVIWTFNPKFDLVFERVEIAEFSTPLQRLMERYSYPVTGDPNLMIYETDNGRFINHSEDSNTDCTDAHVVRARRDIAAGEEITNNYAEFWPEYFVLPGMEIFARPAPARNGHSSQF